MPIVAQGAHRSAYVLAEGRRLARALRLQRWGRLQRFPIAIAAPWGLAIGPWVPYLPLPFPIRLRVLPPTHVSRHEDCAHARERIRAAMQAALDAMAT